MSINVLTPGLYMFKDHKYVTSTNFKTYSLWPSLQSVEISTDFLKI
jgi:hypothetical protein